MVIRMLEFIGSFDLSVAQWAFSNLAGALIGITKTGMAGAGILVVPLMAGIVGGKAAAGLTLPLLSMGDLFAVRYFHSHADWKTIGRLLPWTVLGLSLGLVVGSLIDDRIFKAIIAVFVIVGLALTLWRDYISKDLRVPSAWWFAAGMGVLSGFASMIGNAAGAISSLYFLSMRFGKNAYLGTSAWFFMIVNILKLPLHAFFWKTINERSLGFGLLLIPAVFAGAFIGIRITRRIPEKPFKLVILAFSALAALRLIL